MSPFLDLTLVLLALAGSFLFSGAETGFYCLSRVRLQHLLARGDERARRLNGLVARPRRALALVLIGNNLSHFTAASFLTLSLSTLLSEGTVEIVGTLILTPVLFVLAEVTPKNIFRWNPNRLMVPLSGLLWVLWWVLAPAVLVFEAISSLFAGLLRNRPEGEIAVYSRAGIRYLLAEGSAEGMLAPEQDRIARRLLAFEEDRLRDVMVPIGRVVSADSEMPVSELLEAFEDDPREKIPVYRRRPHNVEGYVSMTELLFDADPTQEAGEYAREAISLEEHMPLDEALLVLQARNAGMCTVVDTRGRVVGLATLEDVLAELVEELEELRPKGEE